MKHGRGKVGKQEITSKGVNRRNLEYVSVARSR
jgi:hypothetical protein